MWFPLFSLPDCHRRRRSGHRLYNSLTRDSLRVAREADCARECGRAGYCRSFSFKRGGDRNEDNCVLSAVDPADIDDRADLIRDNSVMTSAEFAEFLDPLPLSRCPPHST